LGGFRFAEATRAAGLDALDLTYRQWYSFYNCPIAPFFRNWRPQGTYNYESQPGLPRRNPIDGHPYYAGAIFADLDNDGWLDLVVLDRTASPILEARTALFMNRGDGTFEPKPTTFSGLDGSGICGEAADLNNDGLLDLVFVADPDNSTLAQIASPARYES